MYLSNSRLSLSSLFLRTLLNSQSSLRDITVIWNQNSRGSLHQFSQKSSLGQTRPYVPHSCVQLIIKWLWTRNCTSWIRTSFNHKTVWLLGPQHHILEFQLEMCPQSRPARDVSTVQTSWRCVHSPDQLEICPQSRPANQSVIVVCISN